MRPPRQRRPGVAPAVGRGISCIGAHAGDDSSRRSQPRKYDQLHLAGAINLSFPDIAVETLRHTIPDRSTRILIYCNNNFVNSTGPFPTKLPMASLNLSTYIALYSYGYRNVWELAPQVDPTDSLLAFEGTMQRRTAREIRTGY